MGHHAPISPLFRLALAVLAALGLAGSASAAGIRINEIYPNPPGDSDIGGERIEIYNDGPNAIDVTGWCIHDAASIDGSPALRCRIPEDFDNTAGCPAGALIQPGEFRLIKGTTTAAFLNNTGGDDVFLCSNRTIPATVVQQVTYPDAVAKTDSSWAALPNGGGSFAWRAKSFCATNGTLGDVTAPDAIVNLAAAPGSSPGEIQLTWTAPGDDGATGTATVYLIRLSHSPITSGNFAAADDIERWINAPLPNTGGTAEVLTIFGLDPAQTWFFAIETQDEVPNTSAISNSPSAVPAQGALLDPDLGYTPYFGNLHSHTSYSDGTQTPAVAYNYARNVAPTPLDFLAVTEHNHVSAGMQLANYPALKQQAAAANDDGNFVAIFGQEWGLASHGHVNVFEAPVLFGWDNGQYDVFVAEGDYESLYAQMLANPPLASPVVAEWCHPAATDFNNLTTTANGRSVVHLMALVNGPAQSNAMDESDIGNTGFDGEFQEALRLGARVSPTADQDNHNGTWGSSSQSRTAVLAYAKTKAEILSGMAARRTYATQDHNTRVQFSADNHAMGEAFASASGIKIAVSVTDPDVGQSPAQIELFRGITGSLNPAVRIAYNSNSSTFNWRELQTFPNGTEAHYYVRIRMLGNPFIWTGPVYVTYDTNTPLAVGERGVSELQLAITPNPATANAAIAFTLPQAGHARVGVYDATGRLVRTLVDGALGAGTHRLTWDARANHGGAAGAGIYFVKVEAGDARVARKFLLL